MEFDNNVSPKEISVFEINTDKSKEVFCQELWEDLNNKFNNVGDAGNGEFWIDYSTALRTRYLICRVDEEEVEENEDRVEPHSLMITIYGATKSGRISDVIILFLILGAFWFLSKSVVPQPSIWNIIMIGFCILVALGMAYILKIPFGKQECLSLSELIKSHK